MITANIEIGNHWCWRMKISNGVVELEDMASIAHMKPPTVANTDTSSDSMPNVDRNVSYSISSFSSLIISFIELVPYFLEFNCGFLHGIVFERYILSDFLLIFHDSYISFSMSNFSWESSTSTLLRFSR